jgi:hypothetical protein
VIVNDRIEEALQRLSAISRAARALRAGSSDPGAEAIAVACRMERADLSAWGA